jgi:hypothetical protein
MLAIAAAVPESPRDRVRCTEDMWLRDLDLEDVALAVLAIVGNAFLGAWLVGGPTGLLFADASLFLIGYLGGTYAYGRWYLARARSRATRWYRANPRNVIAHVGVMFLAIELVAACGLELWWVALFGIVLAVATIADVLSDVRVVHSR